MALSREIQDFVDRGVISEQQANSLNELQRMALESRYVSWFLAVGWITLEQALQLTKAQFWVLESHPIYDLIYEGTITLEQALGLTNAQRRILEESAAIRELLILEVITFEQAIQATFVQRVSLKSQPIRELITGEIITIAQALQLTFAQLRALEDPEIRQRLINGELTLIDILALNERIEREPEINQGQSTHTASVHETTSASAKKLRDYYKEIILDDMINQIRTFVSTLLDDSPKNNAAKRCIARITADDYYFTDPTSEVSTKQLLALSFAAIHDESKRIGTLQDAKTQFIEGLYEIQRGYNLSPTGVDKGGDDKEICKAGTFNKLVEKLQGIHPDCEIRFITNKTAAFKLPRVVQEEAMHYLSQLANPEDVKSLLVFTRLIDSIKKDGVDVIWNQIQQQVTNRMFDEFACLYGNNKNDEDFSVFIETGKDVDLQDLTRFQRQLQQSLGYHEYYSYTLRHLTIFVKRDKEATISNRHSSPEAQREYDQQFGLIRLT